MKNSKNIVLDVNNLGKEYRIYDTPKSRLKNILTGKGKYRSQWALSNVSFKLKRGQCMGVVGGNGAGKSTLLKLVTKTIRPTNGRLDIDGRITAILELGAGFHPDFTGRQNLYFSGNLIGLSNNVLNNLESEIIAFSELGDAIDRPVKTYSSGMTVRLAFALITAVQPDVLIIDEALAVGDVRFQKKCIERIKIFKKNNCSILFCSHSHYHVRELCDVALWLEKGEQKMFGETESVISAYEQSLRALDEKDFDKNRLNSKSEGLKENLSYINNEKPKIIEMVCENLIYENDLAILNSHDLIVKICVFMPGKDIPSVGFMIEQNEGVGITSATTHWDGFKLIPDADGLWSVKIVFPMIGLYTGEYVLSTYLFDETGFLVLDEWFQSHVIKINYKNSRPGILHLNHSWINL